jgi:hypothetical protein
MTIVILGANTGESTGLLRVGLRVDVAYFVALREAVEITQLVQSFATVS